MQLMKQLYILILLSIFSCTEKTKEKKESFETAIQDTVQATEQFSVLNTENASGTSVEYTGEDISGTYILVYGKTHIVGGDGYESYKAAIVIERLSDSDFGFYAADKTKDISPIGAYGILRKMNNSFHELRICDGKDVEGYTDGNFTSGPYLFNKVSVYQKGDVLGIIQYGGNFRKYMLYKKKKNNTDFYTSLIKTMRDTKQEYQEYLKTYETAVKYNKNKLQINHYLNGDEWLTKHLHNEDYANFEKTHFYQNPHQEGKFAKNDAAFENQLKNLVEMGTFDKEALENEVSKDLSFKDVFNSLETKPLPLIESTTFDDFIEAEDYEIVDAKALKIDEIYPGFTEQTANFRAIRSYKIDISKEFYSVIVTILKGEHEMESVLINYSLNGQIIDSKIISYDEIAEGLSRIESRLTKNTLTINHIFWDVIKEIEKESFTIERDGTIDKIDSKKLSATLTNYPLILDVLEQLKLNVLEVKTGLIVTKAMPQNSDETLVLIPEIVGEDHEYNFELNSHIVLVNNTTGKITHKYFEGTPTNYWVSDALQLKELKIDITPYMITENVRAFGVRVYHYGSSRANPYSSEIISLFMKSGTTLKKLLNNYTVMEYGGEWEMDCLGEFLGSKATLTMANEKTNGYFDIIVENTITETKNYEDEKGDCRSKDEITTEKLILKFDGSEYKTPK